ncbi:MAG: hypothetical protein H0V82_09635 [Candidatus Protochlamydia sp.]|nr:hypothetical protein [Candidatus Protochlamydia sp.]
MRSIIFFALLFFTLLFKPNFFIQAAIIEYDQTEYEWMDGIALAAGTDKSSAYHNYTKVYSQYFKNCRNQPIKFLEIGIYKGDSVKFWEGYFSIADLHFIDITNQYLLYQSNRSKYHFIDQSNIPKLQQFASKEGPFDIILDDGGHTMVQQISSFLALFSSVKKGGLYIIEDLHTSYWTNYGGSGNVEKANEGTTVGYLKNLIDHVNFPGAAAVCADPDKLPENLKVQLVDFRKQIESIHFHPSVCLIEKK